MSLQIHLAALILVAAAVHASWNAIVKISGDRVLTFTVIVATGTGLGCLAAPFVDFPVAAARPYLLAGVFLHNGFYVLLLLSYRFGDLSQVYPLTRGVATIAVTLLAGVFAGEVPGMGTMSGIALVSMGIVGLAFASGVPRGSAIVPIVVALLTGLMLAVFTVVDGLGVRRSGSPWDFIVWLQLFNGIPLMIVAAIFKGKEIRAFLARHGRNALWGGCLSVMGICVFTYALSQGPMAHVSALRETSVLFAALIGAMRLGEPVGGKRMAAACAIVGGLMTLQVTG